MSFTPSVRSHVRTLASLAWRAAHKPPRVVARRLLDEANVELERIRAPRRGRRFGRSELLRATGGATIDEVWEAVLARPYPFIRTADDLDEIEQRWPGERDRVVLAAERALAREIDLLGTGPVQLGTPADWHRDWKTGRRWPMQYARRMELAELDRASDVKVPWEISRLQWLLPAGQAYALTDDDRYAAGARDVLEDWLRGNPFARGVNWAIAMEPALRIFSWTWLVYACGRSRPWTDPGFRARLLAGLYMHGMFVERNLERGEVNGNHFTADAAGLVVAGLVLPGEAPQRWAETGWALLLEELPRQVHPDGTDFEASAAYHRLVGELFALPALLRQAHGIDVPPGYAEQLRAMGHFTAAYTGPDGLSPLWGDADDGRALPLGGQAIRDHGSLPALTAALTGEAGPGNAEAAWLVGPAVVAGSRTPTGSAAFPDGGVYVLACGADHVVVDCGPVGLAGRGGHGHNDCLSFEATLAGTRLVSDCGSYVYTASATERNRFRSTASHNTPRIDGVEQNRIPDSLWLLEDDAQPEPLVVEALHFRGSHTGYSRLPDPVHPIRTLALEPHVHALLVHDVLEGRGSHKVEIPFHLAEGVVAGEPGDGSLDLGAFVLRWRSPEPWSCTGEDAWVSPSYGVRRAIHRVVFRRSGTLAPLTVLFAPTGASEDLLWAWAEETTG
jgi:Heparinase II/III-like protein/Heparinase II/III N-terminus